jgi:hypothetical protein
MGANRYAMNLIAGKTLEPIDKGNSIHHKEVSRDWR